MRKLFIVLLIAFFSFQALPAFGGDDAETPEKLQLKDQMRGLMEAFQRLEVSLTRKPPDYDTIVKTLDDMEARAKTVQSLKGTGHPGKTLKKLAGDIEYFKRNARAKDRSAVEDGMNRLAENCFRCHLSHGEPMKDRTSGNSL